MKKYLYIVLLVGVCFGQTKVKITERSQKYKQEYKQYLKELQEIEDAKKKLELIEKHGKTKGERIFKSGLPEEEYFKKEKEILRLEKEKQKEIQRLEEIERQKRISEEIEKQKEIQRLEEIERQKKIKIFLFFIAAVAVSIFIIIIVKKEKERRKEKLIKLYGEKDGLNIYHKKISESDFKKRNDLIDKHGKELGLEIFNSKLSEDEFFKKDLKIDTLDKEQAKEKLKEAKENLSLELITQEDYDVLKEELKPFIMGDELKPSEIISKDEVNNSKKGSNVMSWVIFCSLIGGGLGWISTISDTSSNKKNESSYSHCNAGRAEQFLYSNARGIAQLQNVRLISKNGNIFTFSHISFPSNQFRNYQCITKVICKSNGQYAMYDVDCKPF